MFKKTAVFLLLLVLAHLCPPLSHGQEAAAEKIFRLYDGVTVFIDNPDGRDFTVGLDIRDLNLFANGPREILFKVYDPDGVPVLREIIPDDGCGSENFPDRIGGWDHELQYYANLYAKGTMPSFRWSAWSVPERLKTLVSRTFNRQIKGGKKGVYRIVLAGMPDIYATLRLPQDMKTAFAGHPNFIHGHGKMLNTSYLYVPKGTSGIFYAFSEPDHPQSRHFKLSAPDGKIIFEAMATGGYVSVDGPWQKAQVPFGTPGEYDGKVLKFEVSDGPNDYLAKIVFQQPKEKFGDYVGMGVSAVYCPDEETANLFKSGTEIVDEEIFWHPFQIRFHEWMKKNKEGLDEGLRKELEHIYTRMRYLENSDGRGSSSWSNWAYSMGYYGFDVFRPSFHLMKRPDVPQEVKDIIKEGLIMAGDRLSFATNMEKVNGNSFAQINVALWYSARATDDQMQKDRFETFWQRWISEGWGKGTGLSRSGDAQEHFAHDGGYGSYLLDNWKPSGNTWVKGGGILGDAADDPRFQKIYDRYQELFSYLYCREAKGKMISAVPWSSRINVGPHLFAKNWETDQHRWKGEPGPDFTVSVNGGDEWFAARRKNYYILTFHGRITPEWLCRCFEGQIGFSGGTICQLTVPGKGPVIAGTLNGEYGKGMDPSQWQSYKVHTVAGRTWDGSPFVAGISEPDRISLEGNALLSSGEIRGAHVRGTRSYKYGDDSVECSFQLEESEYARVMSIWGHDRYWSEVSEAWEMIPFVGKCPDGKTMTAATLDNGKVLSSEPATASSVRIDRGGFGVEIKLDQPRPVKLGTGNTVMIQLIEPVPGGGKPIPANQVKLSYKLIPFGN